ncbi:threonylcarbamoyl-AMP synthase [Deferribacter autotrophicus]|uniref:L-threonylcarbamoyladenylate synthase n=1 Tax=Deferribacter autotrophicus TaxID=500465 RepID=A0A5A8F0D5_9BACT|nr:L-threonylcarbamoyladenylate synthase [Deferribacter autotrophicus]KAA0257308.1 threonylcarbamoyl-AMP synthase [Deferribacter autotrophicus]
MIIYKASTKHFIKIFKLSDKYSIPFIYPTDTIYGIGAPFLNFEANKHIYLIKQRDYKKPFLVLIGNLDQLFMLIDESSFTATHKKIINKLWPGEFTLIFNAKKTLPSYLLDKGKIAVRFPKYKELTEAIKVTFPITSTSANISNTNINQNFKDILNQFKNKVDYFIYKKAQSDVPSTIIDLSDSNNPIFIRNPKNYKIEDLIK